MVYNPLKEVNGTYEMDFEQLAEVVDDKCRLLILSNPHNPAGVCWSKETLQRLAHSWCGSTVATWDSVTMHS